jgi:DNA-binding HxlR family transcriptional regulator
MDLVHNRQVCQIFHNYMEIIGKRWNGAIIFSLFDGPRRFKDIYEVIPDISSRLLNERLKELEEASIVKREVSNQRPIQVLYKLTPLGHELHPIMQLIQSWAYRCYEEQMKE